MFMQLYKMIVKTSALVRRKLARLDMRLCVVRSRRARRHERSISGAWATFARLRFGALTSGVAGFRRLIGRREACGP